ncbi:MAG: alpha/beta fold hydrolase [Candidatus Xenobia bacterium]
MSIFVPPNGLPPVRIRRIPGSERQVLVVPGNPGASRFYLPFMRALHERTGATITALSFPGHEHPCRRFLTLRETIELVELLIPENGLVVGHSIGAYIALKARGTHRVVALYPFLQFDEGSLRQRLLRWIAPHLARAPLGWLASCFKLAMHEFEDLAPPPDIDWRRCQAVIGTPRDVWFPEKHHSLVPPHRLTLLPETSHVFCLSHRQSLQVANAISQVS